MAQFHLNHKYDGAAERHDAFEATTTIVTDTTVGNECREDAASDGEGDTDVDADEDYGPASGFAARLHNDTFSLRDRWAAKRASRRVESAVGLGGRPGEEGHEVRWQQEKDREGDGKGLGPSSSAVAAAVAAARAAAVVSGDERRVEEQVYRRPGRSSSAKKRRRIRWADQVGGSSVASGSRDSSREGIVYRRNYELLMRSFSYVTGLQRKDRKTMWRRKLHKDRKIVREEA